MSFSRKLLGRPLALGQLGLAAGLILCFFIRPQFLRSEGGFSNYGVVAVTIPFFTLGFLSAVAGTFVAARRVPAGSPLKWPLFITAAFFLLVLISTYPYKLNNFYDALHQDISIAFGVWELAFGAWLVAKRHDAWCLLFFAVQFTASVATLLTVFGLTHVLFFGELLAGAGFGALLVRASGQLLEQT